MVTRNTRGGKLSFYEKKSDLMTGFDLIKYLKHIKYTRLLLTCELISVLPSNSKYNGYVQYPMKKVNNNFIMKVISTASL